MSQLAETSESLVFVFGLQPFSEGAHSAQCERGGFPVKMVELASQIFGLVLKGLKRVPASSNLFVSGYRPDCPKPQRPIPQRKTLN